MTELQEQEWLKALRHPVRRDLLRLCHDRGKVTPREAANTLRHPLYNVRYHIKTLTDCGAVRRLGTKMVRGSKANCWGITPTVKETNWILEVLDLPSSYNLQRDHFRARTTSREVTVAEAIGI